MSNDGTHDPTLDRGRHAASAPGDLPEGMEIGEYRVLRKIGEGGMGAVYAAIQPVIGKRVAIKVIAPQIASNPDVVRRFVDEARAVNKIGHPNIVDIFSFGWLPDRRHYFAMEFLDGKSLAERIKLGPLPPAECRRVFRQICEALEAAHRQGIVHRDLKPDNIWIAEPAHGESFAKLLDFGIAKLMGDGDAATRTQTGVMMGTPAYMSPEQCRGEGIDARTDVYALGVILYEMFARRLPFSGGFAELITHHLLTAPKPPSSHAPIPPALDALILSCLEKDVAKRPQSAQELGRALEATLPTEAAGPLPAAPPSPVAGEPAQPLEEVVAALPDTLSPAPGRTSPELTQPPARNRRPLVFVAAAGAAAALALVLSLAGGRRREEPPAHAPASLPVPVPAAAPARAGRAHVVVRGSDAADVLVDGKLVAGGVREAHVPALSPGEPHRLRVEAAGRAPFERTFTVADGAEAELEATLPDLPAEPQPAAARPTAHLSEHPHRRETTASSPTPLPSTAGKAHHRDGLVGDDIFDTPNRK